MAAEAEYVIPKSGGAVIFLLCFALLLLLLCRYMSPEKKTLPADQQSYGRNKTATFCDLCLRERVVAERSRNTEYGPRDFRWLQPNWCGREALAAAVGGTEQKTSRSYLSSNVRIECDN